MSVSINAKGLILMTRGDTLITKVNILNSDGTEYVPAETDKLRFAIKENLDEVVPIVFKEIPIDTQILRVESYETKRLKQKGEYYYDIELTYGDNIVTTILSGKLKTTGEVA